ncbi:hypothetical protein CLOM_g18871 [Closterium sp. NIES-68]|nr:hypothetical protein CLOM_g18871 [Closterium sp. NIES-68]
MGPRAGQVCGGTNHPLATCFKKKDDDWFAKNAQPCVYLGHNLDSPDYLFLNLSTNQLIRSRDVAFDESRPFYLSSPPPTAPPSLVWADFDTSPTPPPPSAAPAAPSLSPSPSPSTLSHPSSPTGSVARSPPPAPALPPAPAPAAAPPPPSPSVAPPAPAPPSPPSPPLPPPTSTSPPDSPITYPKLPTLRTLLDIAARCNFDVHSMDVSAAFLQGDLPEDIYMERPQGFPLPFPPGTVWKLNRPVYGLKQAPREWHKKLKATLESLDFHPSSADPSLFIRKNDSPFFILVYVDDMILVSKDSDQLAAVKQALGDALAMKDLVCSRVTLLPVDTPIATGRLLSASFATSKPPRTTSSLSVARPLLTSRDTATPHGLMIKLTAALPKAIASPLAVVNLCCNSLNGPIPASFSGLASLAYLDLQENALSEAIPDAISLMTALTSLYLSSNRLSGGIPPAIGALTSLQQLFLSKNILAESIPTEMGKLLQLQSLHLDNNEVVGSIPDALSALTNLDHLSMAANHLVGAVPNFLTSFVLLTHLQA